MTKTFHLFAFSFILTLSGCVSNKKLTYFKNLETTQLESPEKPYNLKGHDLLHLSITSSSPEVQKYFSSITQKDNAGYQNLTISPMIYIHSYSVGDSGVISFPFIGEVNVLNKTIQEAESIVRTYFDSYFKTNIDLKLKMINYSFSILGEVNNQGRFYVNEDEINLIEAIGIAGGLTNYGNVNEIKIIREINNQKSAILLDLNNEISTTTKVHPNDIIYVKPLLKGAQKQNPNPMIAIVISAISSLALLVTLISQ